MACPVAEVGSTRRRTQVVAPGAMCEELEQRKRLPVRLTLSQLWTKRRAFSSASLLLTRAAPVSHL